MKKKVWFWLLLCVFLAGIIFVSWQKFGNPTASAEILSEKDAQTLVESRYEGTVTQIKLVNQQYHMELEKENNLYQIKLDAISGSILSFKKTGTKSSPTTSPPPKVLTEDEIKKIVLEEANGTIVSFEKFEINGVPFFKAVVAGENEQTTVTVNAVSGNIISSNSINLAAPNVRLSKEEAGEIAVKQVGGTVDDIWLDTQGGVAIFLVKVETKNDWEVVVQIHAITGKVLSVTWDDHGNDDDKKKGSSDGDDDDEHDDRKKGKKEDDDSKDDD